MEKKELKLIIDDIQGLYHRDLDKNEIRLIDEKLSKYNYTYEKFGNIRFCLEKKVDYFTVQQFDKIVEEDQKLEHLRQSLDVKCFDELCFSGG